MTAAIYAAIGAASGAMVTALASLTIAFGQQRYAWRHGHRMRAFEQHLPMYEQVFASARSAQDALRDYLAIERRVTDRSDPFLRQLLAILAAKAHEYCVAVDWRHNPGMAYLDRRLEERCLRVRDLLLTWLSSPPVGLGNVAFVLRNDENELEPVPLQLMRRARTANYRELRIERRTVVLAQSRDRRLAASIDRGISGVIKELKAVMAY